MQFFELFIIKKGSVRIPFLFFEFEVLILLSEV